MLKEFLSSRGRPRYRPGSHRLARFRRVFLDEMKHITESDFKRFTIHQIAACGTSGMRARGQIHDRVTGTDPCRCRLRF